MTTMNPADVPDDLVQVVRAADDAYIDARTEDDPFDREDHARAIAAAILPLLREQLDRASTIATDALRRADALDTQLAKAMGEIRDAKAREAAAMAELADAIGRADQACAELDQLHARLVKAANETSFQAIRALLARIVHGPDAVACCVCGSADVVYRNYQDKPFCAPCANGMPGPVKAPTADATHLGADPGNGCLCPHSGTPDGTLVRDGVLALGCPVHDPDAADAGQESDR